MARDVALITSWKGAYPGREKKALEVFMDFLTFLGKQAAEGKCSEPEVFLAADGSHGFAVAKGKSEVMQEIYESDENVRLITRGNACVQDLKNEFFYTGDTEVQSLIEIFSEVATAEGYM